MEHTKVVGVKYMAPRQCSSREPWQRSTSMPPSRCTQNMRQLSRSPNFYQIFVADLFTHFTESDLFAPSKARNSSSMPTTVCLNLSISVLICTPKKIMSLGRATEDDTEHVCRDDHASTPAPSIRLSQRDNYVKLLCRSKFPPIPKLSLSEYAFPATTLAS